MKYCSHCGAEVLEEAEICMHCGCRVAPKRPTNDTNKTLGTIAKVLMIITIGAFALGALLFAIFGIVVSSYVVPTPPDPDLGDAVDAIAATMLFVCAGVYALALSWMIPMTVSISRSLKENRPISTAMKVCTLIFVGIVPGILLLCMND